MVGTLEVGLKVGTELVGVKVGTLDVGLKVGAELVGTKVGTLDVGLDVGDSVGNVGALVISKHKNLSSSRLLSVWNPSVV